MAKKSNDELFQSFLADVLATVPTELKADAEKVLKDERIAAKMKDSVLARADYSRTMDEGRQELANARQQFDQDVAEARTRIEGWESWYKNATQEVADYTTKLTAYEQKYGKLDGTPVTTKPSLTEEDFHKKLSEELQKHDLAAITFANDLTRIQFQYFKEFKDELDTDSLIADATKRGVTLKQAYQDHIAPKMKEREDKRFTDAIEKAKEEGRREAGNHRLPMISGPTEPHVLDSINRTDTARTPDDRVAAAIKGWNEIRNQATH